MRPVVILMLALAVSLNAQTARKKPAARPKPAPPTVSDNRPIAIGTLAVEGNQLYPTEKILAATGLKIGQPATKEVFEAARDRLLATGAFETVGYRYEPTPDGKRYAGTFQVVEVREVLPMQVEGLKVDMSALKAHLQTKEPLFGDKIPATQTVLDRFAKAVAEFLKEPQVTAKVLSNRNGELAVVFQPNSLPSVAEVMFKGNDLFATRELQEMVAGAAIGAIYTEERFREIIDTSLRPLYESKGRIRVAFPKFETRPAEKVNGLVVTVHVNEGPVYELRNVSLAGGPESLLKEGAFRLGETVRFDQVQEGVKRIEAAMKRAGYIDAKTAVDRNIDDKEKKLDLVVRATPGQQYKFGKLDIDGLDIQTEPHIRKLWNMKANQPFNAEYPDYFLSRLQSDGVFENLGKTASTLKRDDQNRLVDVTLHFKASGKALPRIGPMSDKEAAREREEQRKRREQNPNDPFPR